MHIVRSCSSCTDLSLKPENSLSAGGSQERATTEFEVSKSRHNKANLRLLSS